MNSLQRGGLRIGKSPKQTMPMMTGYFVIMGIATYGRIIDVTTLKEG